MDENTKVSSEDPAPFAPSASNGEAHGTATVYCSKGEHDVVPVDGRCPVHHIFLAGNSIARRHPVNVLRRDALLADLLAQFPPANVVQRAARGQLASALERLETTKPGTTEWVRLSGVVKELSDDLTPPTPTVTLPELPGIADMPQTALERAQALLSRLAKGDTLSEREQGQLDVLRSAMRGSVRLPPDPPDPPAPDPEKSSRGSATSDFSDPPRPTPLRGIRARPRRRYPSRWSSQ